MKITDTPSLVPFPPSTSALQPAPISIPKHETLPSSTRPTKISSAECDKENFLYALLKKQTVDADFKLQIDKLPSEFLDMEYKDFESLLNMLVHARKIPVYETSGEHKHELTTVTLSWIELLHCLKKHLPDIKTCTLFGSRAPSLLGNTVQKVAQTLMQDPTHPLSSQLLNEFTGDPADTDFLISLQDNSFESFYECKKHLIALIAKSAHLNLPYIPLAKLQQLVEKSSFYKLNIPQSLYADTFALFSLKDSDNALSELVISHQRNEFAFMQDDLSLTLDEILKEFPASIFEDQSMASNNRQKLLHEAKENILAKAQSGALKLSFIKSQQGNLWQIFFDLLLGNLSLPEKASATQERWIRLIRKCSLGKLPTDALEKLAIDKLEATANTWLVNKFSLPYALQQILHELHTQNPESNHTDRIAAIAAYQIQKYVSQNDSNLDALVCMLWHASASLFNNGLADVIAPLWSRMQNMLANKKIGSEPHSLWTQITEAMRQSPGHFSTLATLIELRAFLSLTAPSVMNSNIDMNVALTSCQGAPAFKISEGKYSLTLPAHPSSLWEKLANIQDAIPASPAFYPFNLLPVDSALLLSCLASQLSEECPLSLKKITLESINASPERFPAQTWKRIKAGMPQWLDQAQTRREAVELLKSALAFHLKDEKELAALFPKDPLNIPPQVLWAHALLKLAGDADKELDITKAYNLWMQYREKDPVSKNFSFELSIVQSLASHKPYLAIQLFHSMEESGYSNANEQNAAFSWLLSVLKRYGQSLPALIDNFSSLLSDRSQRAFFEYVLLNHSLDDAAFALLASLHQNMPASQRNTCAFDRMLVDFAVEKIDLLPAETLTSACKLANDNKHVQQAEAIILKLFKNKELSPAIFSDLISAYLCAVDKEEQAGKLLNFPAVENLLKQSPHGLKALQHLLQLRDPGSSPSAIKNSFLKIYLNLCQESSDYEFCLPLVQKALESGIKNGSSLKKNLQANQKVLLNTAWKKGDSNLFCRLFFAFINAQISSGISQERADAIVGYFRDHPEDESLAKEIENHHSLLLSLLPPGKNADLLQMTENLRFQNMLMEFVRKPHNQLLELCTMIEKENHDLKDVFKTHSVLPEHSETKNARQVLADLSQHLLTNIAQLKRFPGKLKIAIDIWSCCQQTLFQQFPDLNTAHFTHVDLLIAIFSGKENIPQITHPLFPAATPISSQLCAIKEMSASQYSLYCNCLSAALAASPSFDEKESACEFLTLLVNNISSFEKKLELLTAFNVHSEAATVFALTILEVIFKGPFKKSNHKQLTELAKSLIVQAHTSYPQQTKHQLIDCLVAGQHVLGNIFCEKTLASHLGGITKATPSSSNRENYIKELEELIDLHIKGSSLVHTNCLPLIESASYILAELIRYSSDFPKELIDAFCNAMQPHNAAENEIYLKILELITFQPIKDPQVLIRFIYCINQLMKQLLAKELPPETKTALSRYILNLSFTAFEDSCFLWEVPGSQNTTKIQNIFTPCQQLIKTLLQHPQIRQSSLHMGTCKLMLGMDFDPDDWYIIQSAGKFLMPRPMTSAEILVAIDSEIHNIEKNMLLPGKAPGSPTGYASFKYISDLLKNAFSKDLYKENYSKYLLHVVKLTGVYLAYIDNQRLFKEMTDILIDLFCAGKNSLGMADESNRARQLFNLCFSLEKMQREDASEAAQKIMSEAAKHYVRIGIT